MNDLTKVIPQLLAQGLLALRENCVMPRLVNSDYGALATSKGATIDVPIPSAIAAQDVVPAPNAPATADVKPTSVSIALDQWKEAPFYMTDKDLAESMEGAIPMQASEAIKSLGNVVDKAILANYRKIAGYAGVAGTTPLATDTKDATNVRKILNKQLAPLQDRRCVLDPDAEGNALNLRAFQDISWAGDPSVIKDGILSPKLGFTWHMDQNVPTHIAGDLTDGVANQAAATVPFNRVGVLSFGSSAGGAYNAGDIITIAGIAIPFTVLADVTIAAGGTADVLLQSVWVGEFTAALATILVDDHVVNLAFHRDCFAFASRPLADNTQGLGNIIQSAVDPVSGLALRLEVSREHKRTRYSYDILFGTEMVRGDLGARLLG